MESIDLSGRERLVVRVRRAVAAAVILGVVACASAAPETSVPEAVVPTVPTESVVTSGSTHAVRLSDSQRTFGPRRVTPPGTVFHMSVLELPEDVRLGLFRCGNPCDTATRVQTWQPGTFEAGRNLMSRPVEEGRYYLWSRTTDIEVDSIISSVLSDSIARITFESGMVLDAWYVTPR